MRGYISKLVVLSMLILLSACEDYASKLDELLDKTELLLEEVAEEVKQDLHAKLETYLEENKEETALAQQADREAYEEQTDLSQQPRESRPNFKNLSLVSWNIQHLGRTKTDEEIQAMAQILRYYDVVAIQEVVAKDPAGAKAVARLADALNRTGFGWDYQVSEPTKSPSPNISERYAFLWKTSKVAIQNRAFLDRERQEDFFREPFIAAFKAIKENKVFYVANYHSRKFSDKPQEEIIHLSDYAERWNTSYMLLAGDFNTPETDVVWKSFYKKGYQSALKGMKTTLKRKCMDGVYVNHPIDNIYYTPRVIKHQAGPIDFVKSCKNLEHARKLSDHLPVFLEFSLE